MRKRQEITPNCWARAGFPIFTRLSDFFAFSLKNFLTTRRFCKSRFPGRPMISNMQSLGLYGWLLVASAGFVMAVILLRAIGDSAIAFASVAVSDRRVLEEQRQADNAAAEAAGKAAMLEPLALNPDGTIEEPIIGVVEPR